MKHLFLFIGFIIFQNLSAQYLLNVGKKVYCKTQIELEDGTIKKGYVRVFADENSIGFAPQKIKEGLPINEDLIGLKNEVYFFRESESSDEEKILLDNFKKIDLYWINKKTNVEKIDKYEKVNLARVTNDLEIQSENEFVLLPLYFSNSKIKIFQYSLAPCKDLFDINCRIRVQHYFYFQKPGESYVIKPLDFNLFSIGIAEDKFYKSFAYLGKDCPEFLSYLENLKLEVEKNKQGKKFQVVSGKKAREMLHLDQFDSYKKDLKTMKKKMQKEDYEIYEIQRKEEYIDELAQAYYNLAYNEIIVQFINSCE